LAYWKILTQPDLNHPLDNNSIIELEIELLRAVDNILKPLNSLLKY
jgi:hypothetical protein